MLETIREFALERLEERPDAQEVHRHHAEHFVAVAAVADSELRGRAQSTWLDRLDEEHDNHRLALRWALDGGNPELGLKLIALLFYFWYLRRPLSEARTWLDVALERASTAASEVRARALDAAGFLAGEQGEDASPYLEESIQCARDVGDRKGEAIAATHLSVLLPANRSEEDVAPG